MRSKKEIELQAEKVERLCIAFRDAYLVKTNPKYVLSDNAAKFMAEVQCQYGITIPSDLAQLEAEHFKLTEQMAVLRWIIGRDWEWDEDGIRDT